jgi:hypothetical protein
VGVYGEKVIAKARSYVGRTEKPLGSNSDGGGPIDRWQAAYGLRRVPWCGCAVGGWYRESGVDDDGLAHPATQVMYDRARAQGAIVSSPIPGCMFVYPGIHTGIVVRDLGGGVVETIEGNTSDSVAYRRRAYGPGTGLYFIAPKAIRVGAKPSAPPRDYYVEDPAATPILRGPWRSKAARDRALARLPKDRRRRARAVRTAPGRYGFLEGPRRLYGPWDSKKARDEALKTLEARLGRNLRRVSRPAPRRAVAADALGKTV